MNELAKMLLLLAKKENQADLRFNITNEEKADDFISFCDKLGVVWASTSKVSIETVYYQIPFSTFIHLEELSKGENACVYRSSLDYTTRKAYLVPHLLLKRWLTTGTVTLKRSEIL